MSLLNREDFCQGSINIEIEDCENEEWFEIEVFIPKSEFAISDDEFEIKINGIDIADCRIGEDYTENVDKVIGEYPFLETVCDYAFAVSTGDEIIDTSHSCKIYIKPSDFKWDEKASENDRYFTSIRTLGADGLPRLQTKTEQLEEIEEVAQEIADLFDDNVISYQNFASHIIDALEQNFVSDEDINKFTIDDIEKESAKWFELYYDNTELNDLKTSIASALNIDIYAEDNSEEMLESILLSDFKSDKSIISDEINNFKIDFNQAVKLAHKVISEQYCTKCTEDNY